VCSESVSHENENSSSSVSGCLVVRTLDLRLNGCEFDYRPPLILGLVTVFGQPNCHSISLSHSASYPQWDGKWVPAKVQWHSAAGVKGRYGHWSFHVIPRLKHVLYLSAYKHVAHNKHYKIDFLFFLLAAAAAVKGQKLEIWLACEIWHCITTAVVVWYPDDIWPLKCLSVCWFTWLEECVQKIHSTTRNVGQCPTRWPPCRM